MRTSKLANPNHPAVRTALQHDCPLCKAMPGEPCVRTTKYDANQKPESCLPRRDHPLRGRVVHIARTKFRSQP